MQTAFAGNLVMSIVCAACVIVLFGSYLAVAIQLLLVMVDSYITILGGGVLFLGFAASRWTAAYAEHLIAHVFYLGARAFFLYLVVAVGIDITNAVQPYLGTADTLLGYGGTLLRVVGAVVAFAVIAWTIPKDVAWRLMGRTSFGLAQAMRALS
jgi:type IV secretory pathway TrbL component